MEAVERVKNRSDKLSDEQGSRKIARVVRQQERREAQSAAGPIKPRITCLTRIRGSSRYPTFIAIGDAASGKDCDQCRVVLAHRHQGAVARARGVKKESGNMGRYG